MPRAQVGLGHCPAGAELSRLLLFWTQRPPRRPRGSPRPGPPLEAVRDSGLSRDSAGQAGRRRQGFEGFFLFFFHRHVGRGTSLCRVSAEAPVPARLATRDRMAPQPGRPLLEPRATQGRCARADNSAKGSALGRAHLWVPPYTSEAPGLPGRGAVASDRSMLPGIGSGGGFPGLEGFAMSSQAPEA